MSDAEQGRPPKPSRGLQALLDNISDFGLSPEGRGIRFWEFLSFLGFSGGLLAIGVYSLGHARVFATLALVAAAAWLAGGTLGFLFGVPRLRTTPEENPSVAVTAGFTPNTNLVQISDWLTKIIVGATLVQLRPLAEDINRLALAIGAQLGTPAASVVSGAVMVTYFSGGFMWGYLWCSLRVFDEMSALVTRMERRGKLRRPRSAQEPEPPPPA